MKLLRLCGCLLVAFCSATGALAQRAAWGELLMGSGASVCSATDRAGNTYLTGHFRGQVTLGNFTVTTAVPSDRDVYIARYDTAGAIVWLHKLSSYSADDAYAITTDNHGNLYVVGQHGAGFIANNLILREAGHFLTRIDATTGSIIWIKRLEGQGTSGSADIRTLATDAFGYCYLGGSVSSLSYFDTLPIQNPGGSPNGFVARCDIAGLFSWKAQVMGAGGAFDVTAIAATPQGEVTIGGAFQGTYSAGAVTLTSADTQPQERDAFIMRFDAGGVSRWAKVGAGQQQQTVNGLAMDRVGNVYVTGNATQPVDFGNAVSPAAGLYLAKLDSQGSLAWLRGETGAAPFGDPGNTGQSLVADQDGNIYLTGVFLGKGIVLGTDTLRNYAHPTPVGTTAALFVASYDQDGLLRWSKTDTDSTACTGYFAGRNVTIDALGRVYVLGSGYGQRAYDQVTINAAVNGGKTFLLRIDHGLEKVRGMVYLDLNGDGYRDTDEPAFPQTIVLTETTRQLVSTSDPGTGEYMFPLGAGAYEVKLLVVPPHYYLTQGSAGYVGTLAADQADTTRYFGLAPMLNQPDVRIHLTAYQLTRPGFINRYRATLENVGTTSVAQNAAALRLDSLASYISSMPAAVQLPGQVFQWNYTSLEPFARRDFDVQFSLPVNVPLGTNLTSLGTAYLAGDLQQANNVDTLHQTVVGSLDPNSIEVNYPHLSLNQVANGQALDYTIRFQNLGTASASSVIIRDTLDFTKIKLASVQYLGSSHNCSWSLSARGILTVRFSGISLPQRDIDAIHSQGFVVFRMVPLPTLADGTIIPNKAHITFDFNPPVRTNIVTTTVGVVGLPQEASASAWGFYPNPTSGGVTVTAELSTAGPVCVRLLDPLGRLVRQQQVQQAPAGAIRLPLDLAGVPAGLYVVQFSGPDGRMLSRRLVRQ